MTESGDSGWGAQKPYPGLRPFHRDEIDIFFGREQQVYSILDRLGRQRFLAVVGTSGCGKSSLVKSGLLGGLESGLLESVGSTWRLAEMRPGNRPLARLATALLDDSALGPELDDESPQFLYRELTGGPLKLVETFDRAALPEHTNLILLVDQFEEIFRFRQEGDHHQADAFVELLIETVKEARKRELPIFIVLTMRSDFLGSCTVFSGLPEMLNDAQYLTPRLERAEYQESIEGPATVFGGEVEPRLVTRLLNDMYGLEDPLPLMQHLLMRLWERQQRSDDGRTVLTLASYEAEGGLVKSLSNHGDELFEALDAEQQAIARVMFKRLCDLNIRRPTTVEEIAEVAGVGTDEVIAVADRFRDPDCSFVMPPPGETLYPNTTLDISHEALFRQWERLQAWSQEEAEAGKDYRLHVDNAKQESEKEGDLYGKTALRTTREWIATTRPNRAWAKRYGTAEEWELTQTFIARSLKRWRWKRFGLAASLLVAAVLIAAPMLATHFATARARAAFELLERARLAVDNQPQLALLLAATASDADVARRPAHDFIRETLGRPIGRALPGNAMTGAMSMSPSGEWLATISKSAPAEQVDSGEGAGACRLRLFRVEPRADAAPVEAPVALDGCEVGGRIGFSLAVGDSVAGSDQPQVAIGSASGEVELWQLEAKDSSQACNDSRLLDTCVLATRASVSVPIDPEDVDPSHLDPPYALALSPDGRWMAADTNGAVKIWDLEDLERDLSLLEPGPDREERSRQRRQPRVDLTDDSLIGSWGFWRLDDGSWNRMDLGGAGAEIPIEGAEFGREYRVTLSRSKVQPASGERERTLRTVVLRRFDREEADEERAWGLPRAIFRTCDPELRPLSVRLSEYDDLLFTGHEDGRVRVWDLAQPDGDQAMTIDRCPAPNGEQEPLLVLPAETAKVASEDEGVIAILHRENVLAAQSRDGTLRVWHLPGQSAGSEPAGDRARHQSLFGLEGKTSTSALSASGRFLVATTDDGEIRSWDTGVEGACRSVVTGAGEEVTSMSVSSDGNWLAHGHTTEPKVEGGRPTFELKYSWRSGLARTEETSAHALSLEFVDSGRGGATETTTPEDRITWLTFVDTGPTPEAAFPDGRLVAIELPYLENGSFTGGRAEPLTFVPPQGWAFSRHFEVSEQGGFIAFALKKTRGTPGPPATVAGLDLSRLGADRTLGATPVNIAEHWTGPVKLDEPVTRILATGPTGRWVFVETRQRGAGTLIDLDDPSGAQRIELNGRPRLSVLSHHRLIVSTAQEEDAAGGEAAPWQVAIHQLADDEGAPPEPRYLERVHEGEVTQLRVITAPSAERPEILSEQLVTAGEDGRVLIWDLEERSPIPRPFLPPGADNSVAFLSMSADTDLMLTGGEDGTVAVWQRPRPTLLNWLRDRFGGGSLEPELRGRMGLPDEVIGGRLFKVETDPSSVALEPLNPLQRLWKRLVVRWRGPDDPLASYGLTTASRDGTICRWDLGAGPLQPALDDAIGRNFYQAEVEAFRPRKGHSKILDQRPLLSRPFVPADP